MGKRDRYEPGTFCWVDLATTDPDGAKAFYGELFGWEAEDIPGGEGGDYTMLRLDGDDVCALYGIEEARREQGVPPHWFNYVSVEDADATAAKARERGGTVVSEPRDARDMGRMAVVADPDGAVIGLWQPGTFIGAGRVNDVGCLGWNELQARDPEASADFYGGLFGWEPEHEKEDGEVAYVTIRNSGAMNGGFMPMGEEHGDAPPSWIPYFTVTSADDTVSWVKELGGEVYAPPFEAGAGRISVVADPQGAVFALFEGETEE